MTFALTSLWWAAIYLTADHTFSKSPTPHKLRHEFMAQGAAVIVGLVLAAFVLLFVDFPPLGEITHAPTPPRSPFSGVWL